MLCDNSMLSTFSQCELKFHLRYQRHRKVADERISTTLGTFLHAIAEAHFSNQPLQPLVASHTEALSTIVDKTERENALAKYFMASGQLLKAYPIATANNQLIILDAIAPPGHPSPRPGGSGLSLQRFLIRYSEIAFQVPFASDSSHSYMGRVDLIVEDANNLLYILDLKTSASAKHATWQRKWRLDTQMKGYQWAVGQHIGKPIAGSIIIPLAMNTKTAELLPEIRLLFTPQQLANWHANALAQIERIDKLARYTSLYDMSVVNSYHAYLPTGQFAGNCSSPSFGICDYYDYCRADYNEGLLLQQTIEHKWSPLAPKE